MNKKILFSIIISFSFCSAFASAKDSVKTGWNVGPLPAVGFDSDRGFQWGVVGELYNFGDGSIYPAYFHKFKTEVSFYTKGSANIQAFYDSKHLIKGVRTMFDVGYFPDRYYDFFGLNTYSYLTPEDSRSNAYNKIDRQLFRFQGDFQKNIYKNLSLAAGIGLQSYDIGRVREGKYENDITLYDEYIGRNVVPLDELEGGTHLLLKLGMIFDTRDVEADPNKGFCSEIVFSGSPDVIDRKGYEHLRMSLTHRHFFSLVPEHLTLAFRAGYQNTLAGDVPYYLLQNMQTFFQKRLFYEGLGGNTTVRGILRNRIVADGVGLANLELRWKFYKFRFIGQNFALTLTPFADAGMVLNQHNADEFKSQPDYEDPTGKLYTSVGTGLKVIMNQNFVISIDMGKALQKENGNMGFYILLNHMF